MFKMLLKSFYCPQAYYNAVLLWRWKTIFYFLLLCAVSGGISSIAAVSGFRKTLKAETPNIVKQLPEISFRNCKISMPDGKDKIVVISTSGAPLFALSNRYLKPKEVDNLLFSIENDRFYAFPAGAPENSSGTAQCIKLSDFSQFAEADKTYVFKTEELLSFAAKTAPFAIPIFVFMGTMSLNLMFLIIMTPACYILSLTLSPNMGFVRAAKFSLIAITPVSILSSISVFLPVSNLGIFYAAATLMLSWFIMKNMPQLPPRFFVPNGR